MIACPPPKLSQSVKYAIHRVTGESKVVWRLRRFNLLIELCVDHQSIERCEIKSYLVLVRMIRTLDRSRNFNTTRNTNTRCEPLDVRLEGSS
jgi:hypothetical protein